MDAKIFQQFVAGIQIESVLLDALHFERNAGESVDSIRVEEVLRTLDPVVESGERLRITARLELAGRDNRGTTTVTDTESQQAAAVFRLVAAVSAYYRGNDLTAADPELVQAFARTSGAMHLTGYLRQFVQETLARGGFPGVIMPLAAIPPVKAP